MRAGGAEPANAEDCFGLGMVYSAGAGVAVDLVQAHKWFNIAAMRGHKDAAQLRREIAEQMSDADIGCAQRAARDWLKAHPQAPAPVAGYPRRSLIGRPILLGDAQQRITHCRDDAWPIAWRRLTKQPRPRIPWAGVPVSVHRQSGEKGSSTHTSRPMAPAR